MISRQTSVKICEQHFASALFEISRDPHYVARQSKKHESKFLCHSLQFFKAKIARQTTILLQINVITDSFTISITSRVDLNNFLSNLFSSTCEIVLHRKNESNVFFFFLND